MVLTAHKGIVVVADDETPFLEAFRNVLEEAGYLMLPARDGAEALARMRGITGPALAIVDLNMPGMDGHELIATMQRDPALARIPVMVVSGQEPERIDGVARFYRKPVDMRDVLGAISDLLG